MLIIGCDFHTRYQQIAMLDTLTGELTERRLDHESGEAHAFYRGLAGWQALNYSTVDRFVRKIRVAHPCGFVLSKGGAFNFSFFPAGTQNPNIGARETARGNGTFPIAHHDINLP